MQMSRITAHDIALVVSATLLFLVSIATHVRDLEGSADLRSFERYVSAVTSALGAL